MEALYQEELVLVSTYTVLYIIQEGWRESLEPQTTK